jgi:hypothetical protein
MWTAWLPEGHLLLDAEHFSEQVTCLHALLCLVCPPESSDKITC